MPHSDDLVFSFRGVVKRFPRFDLGPVDVELAQGRALGVVGQNGAGKSTLLRILVGLVRHDAGDVSVLGRPMPAHDRWIKARVGFVSEDMALYRNATLAWHMDLVRSFIPTWDPALARDLLVRLELDPTQRVGAMSRGQHVKSLLLLALARRPTLLVLDEPTAGLDPFVRDEVVDVLAARDPGQSVVIASHLCDDITRLADDVVFVHRGALLDRGPMAAVADDGPGLHRAFRAWVAGVERESAA